MTGSDEEALRSIADMLARDALGAKHESGHFNRLFSDRFAELYGVPHATTFASGSAALEAALFACGVGPSDEVIVDPFLKYAPLAAVRRRATPVFADVEPRTLTLSPEAVRQALTPRTKAVVVTAHFGHPIAGAAFRQALGSAPVRLVADCAQALLSEHETHLVGPDFDAAIFSFQSSKHLSTGEGGMLITSDTELHNRALEMKDFGWRPGRAGADVTEGWMYRMAEPVAAIGAARLPHIHDTVAWHRAIAALLTEAASEMGELRVLGTQCPGHSFWTWAAEVKEPERLDRGALTAVRPGEPPSAWEIGFCRAGLCYDRPLFDAIRAIDQQLNQSIYAADCPSAKSVAKNLIHLRVDGRRRPRDYQAEIDRLKRAIKG